MKQTRIGMFHLGLENVELFALHEDAGGAFYFCPGRILVGIQNENWENVVAILLHETLEYAMVRHGVRYQVSENLSNDHAGYLFAMDHCAFTEIVARVSSFVTPAMPRLAEAWAKRHKKSCNPKLK